MDPALDSTPERIGGFRVIRRLATGGTSDVLLARAEGPHGFERVVVLKLLLAQYRDDASFERMFAREAAAYARLSHPAIVKLYDFFSTDGQLVMVLEFVDGLPLNKLRALLRAQTGAPAEQAGATRPGHVAGELDDRASLFIASRIYSALAAAHSARDVESGEFAPVIHRDVNPSNVIIPWDGHAKLADFGIAKVAGMQGDTKAGYIKGTYGYMAPEQVRGEAVTPRTDVYAATLLLWELLARRKAIQRGALPDMEVLRAMAEPSLPSLDVLRPDLPAELRDAVKRGLEPNADRRAIFADELVSVLRAAGNLDEGRALLVDALALVRPPSPSEDLEKTMSRTTRASMASFSDITSTGERLSLPADTERVSSVSDPTLENVPLPSFESMPLPPEPPPPPPAPPMKRSMSPMPKLPALQGQTLSFESPVSRGSQSPRPPVVGVPRPPTAPRAGAKTAVGLGSTAVAANLTDARGARVENGSSAPPPPPVALTPSPPPPVPTKTAPLNPPLPPSQPPPPVMTASAPPPPVATTTRPLTAPMPFMTTQPMPPSPQPMPSSSLPPAHDAQRFAMPSYPAAPPPAMMTTPPPIVSARPPPASIAPQFANIAHIASSVPPALYTPPPAPVQSTPPPPIAYGAPSDFEAPAEREPKPRTSAWVLGAAVGFTVMCVVLATGLVVLRLRRPSAAPPITVTTSKPTATATSTSTTTSTSTATTTSTTTATATATATTTTTATATATATAVASSPAPSGTAGDIDTSAARPDHRVFVDGRVVGETPRTFHVSCGAHQVKLGSQGRLQSINVPCGGVVKMTDR